MNRASTNSSNCLSLSLRGANVTETVFFLLVTEPSVNRALLSGRVPTNTRLSSRASSVVCSFLWSYCYPLDGSPAFSGTLIVK